MSGPPPDTDAIATAIEALRPLGDRVVRQADIGSLTTYRVGGAASVLVSANSIEDLRAVAEAVHCSGLAVLVVGRGSNLLISERGFQGVAVMLDPAGFGDIAVNGSQVRSEAAVALPVLARQTVEAGLTGLEWAVGVPGSVGGGVRMNAGGHGSDMASSLVSCEVIDLTEADARSGVRSVGQLDYSYRHSSIQAHEVVVAASFSLAHGDPDRGRNTIREIVRWRRDHQPGGQNAGSVFTNPPGDSAGRIIEEAGLKGLRLRTAMVSAKHANFIQADPGGSADDVYELMEKVRAEVLMRQGIELQSEVRAIGFDHNNPRSLVEG